MTTYNTDFETVALLVLLFVLIYVRTKYSMEKENNRRYAVMVRTVFLADLMDLLGVFAIEAVWPWIISVIINSLYFFLAVLASYHFALYAHAFANGDEPRNATWHETLVLKLFGLLLFLNLFTGILFSIDHSGHYTRGILFPLAVICPLLYFIVALWVIIRFRHKYTPMQFLMLLTCVALSIGAPIFQYLFLSSYLINFYIGAVMVVLALFTLETPDKQELMDTLDELSELQSSLEKRIKEETDEIRSRQDRRTYLTMQMMYALAATIDAKDRYTSGHSARVARYSRMIAEKMGYSQQGQQDIYTMGILHDVGKVAVPTRIINKKGRLTTEEYNIIKRHPVVGSQILSKVTMLPNLGIGARWHHERADGKGYPDKLTQKEIPIEAQIIAVADAYDAMTSYRSYRSVMPQAMVRANIERGKGTQFNAQIADCMLQLIDADTGYTMREYRTQKTEYER